MIPAEAVQAAAKAFRETHFMDDALMNALEAAAAYIAAEAWDRAAASIVDEHGNPVVPTSVDNPYRSQE